jgi:hypothetical protein
LYVALLSWPVTPRYAPETAQPIRKELAERLAKLETRLPAEVFAATTSRGRSRQIDDVVTELAGEPAG